MMMREETKMQKMVWEQLNNWDAEADYPVIPVFAGAYHAVNYVSGENINLHEFCTYLLGMIQFAIATKYPKGIQNALEKFCHLCLVDPGLIEAYLGIRFEEVARHYES